MLTAALGMLAILVAVPLSVSILTGSNLIVPGMETARSVLAMLKDRSPGERTEATLTKTKGAKVATPRQRALGKVHPPELPNEFVEALAPPAVMIETASLAPLIGGVTPLGILPPSSSGGPPLIKPPSGGGGGGVPPENPERPPTIPENPVPPVPEPGTWAMMLLGFGMSGWMIRRRRHHGAPAMAA